MRGSCSKRVMLNGGRLVLVSQKKKDCDGLREKGGYPATSDEAVYVD
jgi:hypothetical protein